MKQLVSIFLCALALCGPAQAHEITFSQVDVGLEEERTRIAVQLPNEALLHEAPSPLPAGTTEETLRSDPLPPDVQASLAELLNARLRLTSEGKPFPLTIGSIQPANDLVVLTATAPPIPGGLKVEANLFPADALHKVFVNIYRAGDLAGQYALDHRELWPELGDASGQAAR